MRDLTQHRIWPEKPPHRVPVIELSHDVIGQWALVVHPGTFRSAWSRVAGDYSLGQR